MFDKGSNRARLHNLALIVLREESLIHQNIFHCAISGVEDETVISALKLLLIPTIYSDFIRSYLSHDGINSC